MEFRKLFQSKFESRATGITFAQNTIVEIQVLVYHVLRILDGIKAIWNRVPGQADHIRDRIISKIVNFQGTPTSCSNPICDGKVIIRSQGPTRLTAHHNAHVINRFIEEGRFDIRLSNTIQQNISDVTGRRIYLIRNGMIDRGIDSIAQLFNETRTWGTVKTMLGKNQPTVGGNHDATEIVWCCNRPGTGEKTQTNPPLRVRHRIRIRGTCRRTKIQDN